ncbi:hypothetical protein ACLOJK_039991 [Asimina triloba]
MGDSVVGEDAGGSNFALNTKRKKSGEEKRPPSSWDTKHTAILLQIMREVIEADYKMDDVLKSTGLTFTVKQFNAETGCSLEKCRADNRTRTLRQWVSKYRRIQGISGMGWDDVRKCFDATDDVWHSVYEVTTSSSL